MNKIGFLQAFRGKENGAKHPHDVITHVGTPKNVSWEIYDRSRRSPKMSQKQPKLKVIIHALGLYQDPIFGRHGMPPRGYEMSLEMSHVIWNEYMDDFAFISGQF